MRYRQFCGLARALDMIGDRWTLLIVRELLAGAVRYGEIRAGLPGVPTNLLADRLRRLEGDGLVTKDDAGYHLTPRGEALRPAIQELIRWGEPLMRTGRGDDAFSARWLVPALDALLRPGPAARVDLRVDGGTVHVIQNRRQVTVGPGPTAAADAEMTADAAAVLALAAGHLDLDEAIAGGVATVDGDVGAARLLFASASR